MSDDPHWSEIPYDEYREANPAHDAQALADLINWEPAIEMPERPEGQTVQCLNCHQWFKAEAQEFRGKWRFSTLCSPSCGGSSDELIAKCEPGRTRTFGCPRCGIPKSIEPERSGLEWHYFGQCSHCGETWGNAYNLILKCPDCGKRVAVTPRNPQGKCKCSGSNEPY